jgi:pimeloyl-ACP methyl ester carboxylesterase
LSFQLSAIGDSYQPKLSARQNNVQTITIGDITVLRALPANRSGPPVLFVHGYFVDGTVWSQWLPFFAARGMTAYAINLRGRSGSRPGTSLGHASMEDFADDASQIARDVGAAAVVGHSMGGLIAQKLAERGDVKTAVLITPAPPRGITVLSPRVALLQLKYLPSILMSRPVHPGRDDLRKVVLNRVPSKQQDELLKRMLPDSGRAGRDMSITGFPVDASRVRCPMLVVAAENDKFIPPQIVARIAKRYDATLRTEPDHGHMVIVEPGWESLAADVERWIREHT